MAQSVIKQSIKTDSTTVNTSTQNGNATPYQYYGSKNIGIKKVLGVWAYSTSTAIPLPVAYNPSNGYVGVVSSVANLECTVCYSYVD